MIEQKRDHLPRLAPEAYRGQAYVHWTMTIADRRSGWLIPVFNYKFRELLTHAAFRYAFACPIYCLMPDHFHMVWVGIDDRTDQLKASKYFRKQVGVPLSKLGFDLQHQPYDHVLREEERQEAEFENVVEYIARNPERKGLVPVDGFRDYKYTGCLVPGYPELELWQDDFWPRFWRTYSFLRKNGLFRPSDEELA
jgi:putative transposase